MIVNYKGRNFYYGDEDELPDNVWFINTIEETMQALFPTVVWKFYYTEEDGNNDYKLSMVGYNGKYLLLTLDLNATEEFWTIDDEDDAIEKLDMLSNLEEFETKKDLLKYSRKYGLEIE